MAGHCVKYVTCTLRSMTANEVFFTQSSLTILRYFAKMKREFENPSPHSLLALFRYLKGKENYEIGKRINQ